MNRESVRIAFYSLAGAYLIYLAYNIYKQLSTAGSERIWMIVFIVFFVLVGLALIGMGVHYGWKSSKEAEKRAEEDSENQSEDSQE